MKILVVCQLFYPEQFEINDICFTLAEQGHDITVITGLPNYPEGVILKDYRWFKKRNEEINGVEVIRVPLIGRGNSKIRLALNYLSYAVSASIKVLFMKKRYETVLVYQLSPVTMTIPAILYKALTGKRIFLYCTDLWPESVVAAGISKESLLFKVIYLLSRWIYTKVDRIAISSRLFAKYFKEVLKIESPLEYIPAYAESLFENIDNVEQKSTNGPINLVFAGNIGEVQSVDTIIKAAGRLKDNAQIKWHIVGAGSAFDKCQKLADKLRLKDVVIFYGQKPIEDMPFFYHMADAFLVTLSSNETISYTLPKKVQSYMAAGKPIIGAINGETSVVINEAECGLCCGAEDFEVLAMIALQFANEKEKHLVYGRNAKEYYNQHFKKGLFINKFISILEKVKR